MGELVERLEMNQPAVSKQLRVLREARAGDGASRCAAADLSPRRRRAA